METNLRHLEDLSAKSTSYLPQSITIFEPYQAEVLGRPTVKFDLSQEDIRHQTEVTLYNKERGSVSAQSYRDGQLVGSEGRQ
jgi:hypothetical protein